MLTNDRFALNAGVEIMTIEPGYAKARMLVTKDHLNAGGVCQGGALFTLADLAFAAVGNSRQKLTLSLTTTISFLHTVSSGYVYADAVEVFNHAKIPFIEVRLTDEHTNLVAVFTSTGYRKKDDLQIEGLI